MAISSKFHHFFTIFCLVTTITGATPKRRHITVDGTGKLGDYKTIQDAVNSVPSGNSEPVFIRVEPGIYPEQVVVPADKQLITLSGRKANVTVVTWGYSGDIDRSPTVTVFASNFIGRYITFQNSHGEGSQAVALRVTGDKAAFYGCRMLSYQDTLFDESGRHYYKNCYIEGATDFIFGNAASQFEKCHLHSISNGNGAITAQRRESATENTGFYFLMCKVTALKSCVLGRPWGAYARVVFSYSYMSSAVLTYGWDDWGKPKLRRTVYYGEYACFGPGAKRLDRVDWSRSLTIEEAEQFSSLKMIDGTQWIQ